MGGFAQRRQTLSGEMERRTKEEGCGMEESLASEVLMQTRFFSLAEIVFTNTNP